MTYDRCENCGGPTDDERYCPACACPRCGGLGQGDGDLCPVCEDADQDAYEEAEREEAGF